MHKYEYDLFISYAHLDNEPAQADAAKGWITQLHRGLEIRLSQLLGRQAVVWRDNLLASRAGFEDAIMGALEKSAVMVMVISPTFVVREWFVKEFGAFIESVGERLQIENKSRIFGVIVKSMSRDTLPEHLQGLIGYEFFVTSPEEFPDTHTLNSDEPQYWIKVDDLCRDINGMLAAIDMGDASPGVPGPLPSATFRAPTSITDLAEHAGDYIEYMRVIPDNSVSDSLVEYAASFFADVPATEQQLRALAVMFVDRIYRYAAELSIKDAAVTAYFANVTRYVLDFIAGRGLRVFYILDNQIRQDRFELTMDLMFSSGVSAVAPYRVDGSCMQSADVLRALQIELLAARHVAYIEKDASVNHLQPVTELACSTARLVIFRNQAPTSPAVEIIPSRRVPSGS